MSKSSITIIKGSDPQIAIALTLVDSCNNYTPIDLTGKTVSVKYLDDTGTLQTISGSPGIDVIDATGGKFILSLTDAQTEDLAVGYFNFDVYVVDGADTDIIQFENKVVVKDRLR